MTIPDFQRSYFELFDLPQSFAVDQAQLGARYRQLQKELHPDRYAGASAHEQRLAVQYSALINEAYATLRRPLARSLYLLQLSGVSGEDVAAQQIDGGFLIAQMDLREKLESIPGLVDPETALDHLVSEIGADMAALREQFSEAHASDRLSAAASACVKMQYLDKLLTEAEQMESRLMDKKG